MSVYSLNGKVALVTGAARGIGFETARQIHMRGGSVAVLDLDEGDAREAAERIGERTLGIGADVTDHGAMMAAVAETVERFGGLDVAVANAGIAQSQADDDAGALDRGMGARLRGRPARRLAHLPGGAAADRRAQGAAGPDLLRLRLHERDGQQPLRGRQGRGRVDGQDAADRAQAAGRERDRRLLRLGRHEDGPGRDGAGGRGAAQRVHPGVAAEADRPRRGGGGPGPRDRRTGAAGLRAEVVALRLGAARAGRCR